MTANDFWSLFCETGDIVFYLIYKELSAGSKTDKKTA